MKLYSWNVNGIRAVVNKGAFKAFIKEHDPDILGLQETKAMQGQAEIDLPKYNEYWNSALKKGYSGTAIFSKIKPINVTLNMPSEITDNHGSFADDYGDPLHEGRITTAEFNDFYYVTVYTPNTKGDLTRLPLRYNIWDPGFLSYLKHLQKHKPVIVSGDLNVAHSEQDLANPKANIGKAGFTNEERQGFQNFLNAGFIDTFRHFTPTGNGYYTWWTHWANSRARNVGWRIDYFLISDSLKNNLVNAQIHANVMGSDHCPVSIELKGLN